MVFQPTARGKAELRSAFGASSSSLVVPKAKPVSAPFSSSRPRVTTIEDDSIDSVEPASASSLVDPYCFCGLQWYFHL